MTALLEAHTDIETLAACPLCESTSWTRLAVPAEWIGYEVLGHLRGQLGLVRCRSCGLTFTNPRPSLRALASFYGGDTYVCHQVNGAGSAAATAEFVFSQIARYLPSEAPRALLDYGAGAGAFMACAAQQNWTVRGFEPGRRGLHACLRSGLNVTDNLADLLGETFGLVTLLYVFEHLPAPKEALRTLRRLVAPNGRLFLGVPNASSLRARLAHPWLARRFPLAQRHRAFPIHLMYYSKATLRRMLAENGWKVEAMFTMGLGVDEFLSRPNRPRAQHTNGESGERGHHQVRRALRDAFLRLGLGENLAVVAYPAR